MKKRYGIFKNLGYLARDIARHYPILFLLLTIQVITSLISPLLALYIPKLTLDMIMSGAMIERALYALGGAGLIMAACMALSGMADSGRYMIYNDMRNIYKIKLYFKSLDCDYINVESAAGQRAYTLAMNCVTWGDSSGTSIMVANTVDLLIAVGCFIIYSSIIANLSPIMVAALILFSIANYLFTRRAVKYEESARDELGGVEKRLYYVKDVAGDVKWGKDIRVYAMSKWLLRLSEALSNAYAAVVWRVRRRYFAAGVGNAFTLFLRDALSYGYLIWAVANARIELGEFVLCFGAISGFAGFINKIVDDIGRLSEANIKMNNLRAFLECSEPSEPEDPVKIDIRTQPEIEFKHVRFSYGDEPVLEDFNLKIYPGENIALVGVNGAGKTTIVKLLCGLYAVDGGEILINGVNVNRLRRADLFSMISAVFQDIFIEPFTVYENVSMKPMAQTDRPRALECLKSAGLYDEIAKYEHGADAIMLREMTEGVMLSGGQQQKLLMARALYKNAPILILDEPTAALDPIAESETYESFHAHSRGKTTIYISHRLASAKFCDRVTLLSNGKIIEQGSHDELLKLGGEYARMYEVQSHYYKEGAAI